MTHPALPPEYRVAARASHAEYLPAGTLLICTEGQLDVTLPRIGLGEAGHAPRLRLSPGDTCQLEDPGWVRCDAQVSSRVRILAPAAAPGWLPSLLARVARRAAVLRLARPPAATR